jgi:hydroxymethylpyrimidine/phosphomethylpyrimidine kinase
MTRQECVHRCCLTIAGSDSGGNAGVQADLRAFHAYKVHGCTVFSALTAQNPNGVYAIHSLPASFVSAQLDAVFETYSIAAIKTGMLANSEIVEAVAEKLRSRPAIVKVVDPVMVSTSGARLLPLDAVDVLTRKLLPLASLITPNIPEAEVLSGMRIDSAKAVRDAAEKLSGTFGCAVLVKGGHFKDDPSLAEDTLFDGGNFKVFSLPRIENPVSTHGTGCTLSSAIAAELACGADIASAVEGAKKYLHNAIAASYRAGENCGVLGF